MLRLREFSAERRLGGNRPVEKPTRDMFACFCSWTSRAHSNPLTPSTPTELYLSMRTRLMQQWFSSHSARMSVVRRCGGVLGSHEQAAHKLRPQQLFWTPLHVAMLVSDNTIGTSQAKTKTQRWLIQALPETEVLAQRDVAEKTTSTSTPQYHACSPQLSFPFSGFRRARMCRLRAASMRITHLVARGGESREMDQRNTSAWLKKERGWFRHIPLPPQ